MKLLIVDDEQKIRELIGKYAAFEGYGFLEAADGMEAVEIVRNQQVDLVILDIMMPELAAFPRRGKYAVSGMTCPSSFSLPAARNTKKCTASKSARTTMW